MFKSFAPQAFALCLAAMVTLSVLASIALLATRQHAGMALARSPAAAQQVLVALPASHS